MIALDSCILISAMEHPGALGDRARDRLTEYPEESFAISPMVELECLVGPLRADDHELADAYRDLFSRLASLELGREEFHAAAALRARHRSLRTVDALHLATAQLGGYDAFWTNDARLSGVDSSLAVDVMQASSR